MVYEMNTIGKSAFWLGVARLSSGLRLGEEPEKSLAAGGTFVGINNRISQSVPHLHIHIVPRRKDDKLFTQDFSWRRQPYTDEEALLQMQETIQAAVEGNRSPVDGGM